MKPTKRVTFKFDSAASDNYIRSSDAHCLSDIEQFSGSSVTLPDDTKIKPSHKGILPLHSSFSNTAKTATILPKLQSSSLISVGKICDDNNHVIFNKNSVHAIPYNDNIQKIISKTDVLLQGKRNHKDNLYDIPIEKTSITENNFKMPRHLASLSSYKTQSSSQVKQHSNNVSTGDVTATSQRGTLLQRPFSRQKSSKPSSSPTESQDFDDILRQPRKADLRHFQTVNLMSQLNVIIRKKYNKK